MHRKKRHPVQLPVKVVQRIAYDGRHDPPAEDFAGGSAILSPPKNDKCTENGQKFVVDNGAGIPGPPMGSAKLRNRTGYRKWQQPIEYVEIVVVGTCEQFLLPSKALSQSAEP
jgi:hypothetical protein